MKKGPMTRARPGGAGEGRARRRNRPMDAIRVIGAGLAGCEAAWAIAQAGVRWN